MENGLIWMADRIASLPNPRDDASLSDEVIVKRVIGGEVGLFELIMRRYNQRLYRAARAFIRDEAEAEDIIQQAYLNAYAHLEQFAGRASFATWLITIAINEARRRAVQRGRYEMEGAIGETERDGRQSLKTAVSMEHEASVREMVKVLEGAIDALPEHLRPVFMLRDIEQLSVAETALALDLREATVKTRLHRARRFLRRALLAHFGEEALHVFEFGRSRCDRVVANVLDRISSLPQRHPELLEGPGCGSPRR
jgi:RNA polymerase sigma-70 factor, ECF subfamily